MLPLDIVFDKVIRAIMLGHPTLMNKCIRSFFWSMVFDFARNICLTIFMCSYTFTVHIRSCVFIKVN